MSEFENSFRRYKEVPIAIYGLGIKTKAMLDAADGFQIVGLAADNRIGELVYGHKVYSIEEIQDVAKMVIIAAQYRSVKLIYERIRQIEKKGIAICDMSGQNLAERYLCDEAAAENSYWNSEEAQLIQEIDAHDIISFDIFDTLIQRKVLEPSQIFDIMERDLIENGISFPFREERIRAERHLKRIGKFPNLNEIYMEMAHSSALEENQVQVFKAMEIETEKKYAVPRVVMINALKYAQAKGKKVWILSDLHYEIGQIKELLERFGINFDEDRILISCEIGKAKDEGMIYEYFLDLAGSGSKLHIGADPDTDVAIPSRFGIDTFYIMSAPEMIRATSIRTALGSAVTLDDHIALGIFASKILNDPFVLSGSKGKLPIENLYDLGYICFAPLTLSLLGWMTRIIKGAENSVILFSARDGFLIRDLYQKLTFNHPNEIFPDDLYLYISRRAVTVSAIEKEEDIIGIVDRELEKTVGDLQVRLEQHLGISFPKEDPVLARCLTDTYRQSDRNAILARVLQFKEEILNHAAEERYDYLKYLERLGLDRYQGIWLFDLFTRGTSYSKLKKLTGRGDIRLLCFAAKDVPNECISDAGEIFSLLGNLNLNAAHSFVKLYQLFEIAYASQEGQLYRMDQSGLPIFEENSEYQFIRLKELQNGISEYLSAFSETAGVCWKRAISPEFADSMCGLLLSGAAAVSDQIGDAFEYSDRYGSVPQENIWGNLIY